MAVSVFVVRSGFGDALCRRPVGLHWALVIVFTSTQNESTETPLMTQQTAARGDNLFDVVLRGALLPTAVAGVVTALVLTPFRGGLGLVSALVGVAIGLVFFASGLFIVGRFVRDNTQPALFMAVGMAVYFAQVILLLGVLVVARQIETFDSLAAGIALAGHRAGLAGRPDVRLAERSSARLRRAGSGRSGTGRGAVMISARVSTTTARPVPYGVPSTADSTKLAPWCATAVSFGSETTRQLFDTSLEERS